jgi:hypothetical protein
MYLSTPAYMTLLAYLLVAAALFIPWGRVEGDEDGGYHLKERVYSLLMMIIPVVLTVYTVNCMVVGQCYVWSWFHVILIALWSVAIFSSAVWLWWMGPMKREPETDVMEEVQ